MLSKTSRLGSAKLLRDAQQYAYVTKPVLYEQRNSVIHFVVSTQASHFTQKRFSIFEYF